MSNTTQDQAINLGLLKFPPPGEFFPGRGGASKHFVIDTRGAGTILPLRRLIVDEMQAIFRALPPFDVLAGIAKSGTVWAAWVAWANDLPFANVLLDGPRSSGLQREVEGDISGRRVLLVDNWMRSGDSFVRAKEVVLRSGGRPVGGITIVRFSEKEIGLPMESIWELKDLLLIAKREGLLSDGAESAILNA